MSGEYGTPYMETEILLAYQSGDKEHVSKLIEEMLPGERIAFEDMLEGLARFIRSHRRER